MKTTLRIPTKDQYAFVEIEIEEKPNELTKPEDVRALYDAYTKAFQDGEGLPDADWREWLDEYIETGTVVDGTDAWALMNERQKWCVNEIKKSLKRTKHD